MKISMSPLFILWSLVIMAGLGLASCSAGCIKSERDALLKFKLHLTDPSNRLADWANNGDYCKWTGVVCHNITGHVLELQLRTLSQQEYFGPDQYAVSYEEYNEYRDKSALGGKVSSSLLHLKHLRYLDLSYNLFEGVTIPRFLGSMRSLRYLNLSFAAFRGTIPPQLGNLSNLHYLNLQGFYNVENLDWISGLSSLEFLDLSYVDLSKSFDWLKVMSSLPSLVELHLSTCQLASFSPLLNLNFSSLSILDLSCNNFGGPIPNVLQNMTSFLKELDLSVNYFDSSIPNWLYGFSHLQNLNLHSNKFQGQISIADFGNLTSLISLDLSYNYKLEFEQGISKPFQNLCKLRSLYLSGIKIKQEINVFLQILSSGCISDVLESLGLGNNELSGHLTDFLGYFKNLRSFNLEGFFIHGPIPRSLKHLCNLRSLSFSGVKLGQEINDVLEIMSGCVSDGLQSLMLNGCQLSGHLTDSLSQLKNLTIFDLYNNSISGPIPLSLGEMTSLRQLYLHFNRFNGTLPASLGQLTKLEILYISDNLLEGEVSELHFANLTKLRLFYASRTGKSIAFRVSPNWIPPLQLEVLELQSWHIGPHFPLWLRSLQHLNTLDLSYSGISSPIPIWFFDLSNQYWILNFSHNQMHGSIPNIPSFGPNSAIDLSSNNFSGLVPFFSSNLSALDLSNNSFSGSISNFLCYNMHEVKYMQLLNLEGNFLSGEIPNCWMSWKYLVAIKLSNNKFSGNIPNSIGTLSLLQSLRLRDNNLSGVIPLSLSNCTSLITLDVSENNLIGNIPTWIGDGFSELMILNLRANQFDGRIPKELCRLTSLHILDLANNALFGTMPSCFYNFTAMATNKDSTGRFYFFINVSSSFIESTLVLMKGKIVEYSTILRFVRSIDLSNNKLSGEIPKEITRLVGIQSLNLSQNALGGRIPVDIGVMRSLESLDLSENKISGEIPPSISSLTFLNDLNLSNNKLWGKIPTSTQLQSFNSSSFIGNELCGPPLTNNCSVDDPSDPGRGKDNGNEIEAVDWFYFYVSIAPGFVVGFWGVIGPLVFNRQWRHLYFNFLDRTWSNIWVWFHVYGVVTIFRSHSSRSV